MCGGGGGGGGIFLSKNPNLENKMFWVWVGWGYVNVFDKLTTKNPNLVVFFSGGEGGGEWGRGGGGYVNFFD